MIECSIRSYSRTSRFRRPADGASFSARPLPYGGDPGGSLYPYLRGRGGPRASLLSGPLVCHSVRSRESGGWKSVPPHHSPLQRDYGREPEPASGHPCRGSPLFHDRRLYSGIELCLVGPFRGHSLFCNPGQLGGGQKRRPKTCQVSRIHGTFAYHDCLPLHRGLGDCGNRQCHRDRNQILRKAFLFKSTLPRKAP